MLQRFRRLCFRHFGDDASKTLVSILPTSPRRCFRHFHFDANETSTLMLPTFPLWCFWDFDVDASEISTAYPFRRICFHDFNDLRFHDFDDYASEISTTMLPRFRRLCFHDFGDMLSRCRCIWRFWRRCFRDLATMLMKKRFWWRCFREFGDAASKILVTLLPRFWQDASEISTTVLTRFRLFVHLRSIGVIIPSTIHRRYHSFIYDLQAISFHYLRFTSVFYRYGVYDEIAFIRK